MVGDGERGEFQLMRLVHQPVQPAGAIEQRILGVQMEMNKVRVRHAVNLPLNCGREQDADVHTNERNRDWFNHDGP